MILYSMDLLKRNQNSFALKRAMQNDSRWLCDNRLRQLTWNASSNTGGTKGFSVASSVDTSFTEYTGAKYLSRMLVLPAVLDHFRQQLSSSSYQVSFYPQAKR